MTRTVAPFTWPGGKRAALSITFDDARPSQLDNGMQIFTRHGLKATFYALPDGVRMRRDGWKQVVAAGHEIGNHTVSHPCSGNFAFSRRNALEDYTLERMERDELLAANDALEELLGVRPRTFAYPCGQRFVGAGEHTRSYVPVVARHFTVGREAFDETPNDPTICDLAQIAALDMDGRDGERLRSLVRWAIDEQRWLVLAGHDVGARGPQTVASDSLEELCRYTHDRHDVLWTDTVFAIGSFIARARRPGSGP